MDDHGLPALREAQLAARAERLLRSNEVSGRYGLLLSGAQARALTAAEGETLRALGRLEFGGGILPRLAYAFCDSPYMTRGSYADMLEALQELFYTFKNELDDTLTDDELVEAMHTIYHGKARGTLEYLETVTAGELEKALRGGGDCGDDEDD